MSLSSLLTQMTWVMASIMWLVLLYLVPDVFLLSNIIKKSRANTITLPPPRVTISITFPDAVPYVLFGKTKHLYPKQRSPKQFLPCSCQPSPTLPYAAGICFSRRAYYLQRTVPSSRARMEIIVSMPGIQAVGTP